MTSAAAPLISIGIPVFNEGPYLDTALESAVRQTHSRLEIVVSDNGSTDGSHEVALAWAKRDPRVRVTRQPENIGALRNFDFLRQQATGDYFCWLGGHDVMEPRCLETALALYRANPGLSLVYPRVGKLDGAGTPSDGSELESDIVTLGLPRVERARKVLTRLNKCSAIHGLMPTRLAKGLPFRQSFGPDFLMLFWLGLRGEMVTTSEVLYWRRECRPPETEEQSRRRYVEYQLYKEDARYGPFVRMSALLIRLVRADPELAPHERARILWLAWRILPRRFRVSRRSLWRYLREGKADI